MNKLYNILAILCLMVSGLGAYEGQEKPSTDEPGITTWQVLGKSAPLYVVAHMVPICWSGQCSIAVGKEVKSALMSVRGQVLEEKILDKNIFSRLTCTSLIDEAAGKASRAFLDNSMRQIIRSTRFTAPVYFGGMIAYTKYQQSKSQLTSNE